MRALPFLIVILILSSVSYAQSPHGKNFKLDCKQCHSEESWKVIPANVSFKHSETAFNLVGQHQTVQCRTCHSSLVFSDLKEKTTCISCHKDIHENTVGSHCERCHSPNTWIVDDVTEIHRMSRFPLLGNHSKVDCKQCHKSASTLRFDPLGITCYDCHQSNYMATQNPNHIKAGFSTDCQQCHNIISPTWVTSTVDHSFFPLTGGHAISNCFECHSQGSYTGLSKDCYSCHKTNYNGTTNPNHMTLGFPTTCDQCHTITVWKNGTFNHSTTPFPLTGAHTSVSCANCHTVGYNVGQTPNVCYGCHQAKYNSTTTPNHVTSNIPTTCEQCHNTTAWQPSTFNHASTLFPLTGAHITVSCGSCHKVGYNAGQTSSQCYDCHQDKFSSAPNHAAQNYPHTCMQCHVTTDWKTINFDHNSTVFPLTGSHLTVSCQTCHSTKLAGLATECVGCHQDKYNSAPNHVAQSYPTDCKMCHSTVSWTTATFDHSSTPFPLTGAHTTVACASCHTKGFSVGQTPNTCYACHQTNYNNTTNPNHVSSKIPTTCDQCHNTTAWQPSMFNHATTPFPLTGAHISVACSSCHTVGYSTGQTPNTCYACHQTNYTNTTSPNHVTSKIPTTCDQCHNTTAWQPSTFNHATTPFPLTGAHTSVACSNCHTVGYSSGQTPNTCYACHQTNYNNTTNPNHISAKFPTTCDQCHTTTAWSPASFNHSTTPFPLTGAHTTVPCASCHTVGYNVGQTPNTCYGCHQTNYNNTTNPNHVSAGFPTTCETCHSTTNWTSSTFNHSTTPFPLTGAHTTVPCASCHTVGYNVGQTPNTCYGCHQANYNSTTNPNHAASGFPTTCETCHSTTNWTSATFNHSTTPFPLTGAHTTVSCASCHTVGYNVGQTPNTCYGCHQSNYNSTTNPNHASAQFPTACEQCHTTTAWTPSTFNHDGQYFPIYSGSHKGRWTLCSDCHNNATNFQVFTCINCHAHSNKSSVDSDHRGVSGYVYSATSCYTCHPTGRSGG